MARRVDRDGALHILGVGVRAFDNYRRTDPAFPQPDPAGRYSVKELGAWKTAQPKPTRGAPRGHPKPKSENGYPCENEKLWPGEDPCPAFLRRRWRFEVSDDGADDVFLCKPHLVKADRERKAGKR
jgi:hypothetical protein